MPTRLRERRTPSGCDVVTPSTTTSPLVGNSRPFIKRPRVLLPEPFAPTTESIWPSGMVSVTLSTAGVSACRYTRLADRKEINQLSLCIVARFGRQSPKDLDAHYQIAPHVEQAVTGEENDQRRQRMQKQLQGDTMQAVEQHTTGANAADCRHHALADVKTK